MRNQRKGDRTRTFLGGKIIFNQRSSVIDCLVRNLSSTGAKLTFTNTAAVPDEFELWIPKQQRTFLVRMIWRRANEAGIVICKTQPRPEEMPLDVVRKLKRYEDEKAALEKRVEQLCSAE